MRPAGMSSEEDEDDDYFSMYMIPKKSVHDVTQSQVMGYLPPCQREGLFTLLGNSSKSSLFHRAAEEADFGLMETLLEDGVSIDYSKINEWTPLMKASSMGYHEVVHFLLEKGANPNLHKELFTPLMACCTPTYVPEDGRLKCARLLIQFGANVNATDKHKTTALMMCASNGWAEILTELLNCPGIDLNLQDKEGWNALFHAINHNNRFIAKKLINAGINIYAMNRHREYDAIQLAEMKNSKDIIKFLKQFKGDLATAENANPPVEGVNDTRKYLLDFRNQFPDEKGRGGFSRDIRDIFLGVGHGKLYDRLKITAGFPEFLTGANLAKLGVKYKPMRFKLQKGIHRYHLVPWSANSLYSIHSAEEQSMNNYIEAISNLTKHLAIMYSTLDYVRNRIGNSNGKICGTLNMKIIDLLTESYIEIQKTKTLLENISGIAAKIKPIGEIEADFVGQQYKRQVDKNWKGALLKAGIVISILYLCCKFRNP